MSDKETDRERWERINKMDWAELQAAVQEKLRKVEEQQRKEAH